MISAMTSSLVLGCQFCKILSGKKGLPDGAGLLDGNPERSTGSPRKQLFETMTNEGLESRQRGKHWEKRCLNFVMRWRIRDPTRHRKPRFHTEKNDAKSLGVSLKTTRRVPKNTRCKKVLRLANPVTADEKNTSLSKFVDFSTRRFN